MRLALATTGGCRALLGLDSRGGGCPYVSSSGSIARLEAVTHPGIGHNIARGIWRGLKFLAELCHEHAQVFNLFRALTAPHGREQGAMRYYFAGVAGEKHEQVKFFRR